MKLTKVMIVLFVVALFIFGFAILMLMMNNNSSPAQSNASSSSASTFSSSSIESSSPTQSTGIYTQYSADAVSANQGKKKVLFFYAAWCPSCRQQDENLSQSAIPADLAIFKVDYDNSTELKQKYGVTLQHTFVQIDDASNKLKSWNSLYQEYDLQGILNKLV